MDPAVEHQLAHLQRRKVLQDHHLAAEQLEPFVDRAPPGQLRELLGEDRLVGRLQLGVAGQELDHVVALVHAVLDQRIAGERTDHVEARLARLELRAECGERIRPLARKADAAGFDEPARRLGAGTRDDAVAADRLLPVTRIQHQLAGPNFRGRRLAEHDDPAVCLGLGEQLDVGPLGTGEVGAAIEDRDDVALGRIGREAERVLDSRVARSNDGDVLVVILAGIVELVLDVRQLSAGHAQQVRVALRADGQHHGFGANRFAPLQLDREVAFLARDRGDVGIQHHVDRAVRDLAIPGLEDGLALAGIEVEIAAQHQVAGRRHHVLALLVLEDGVGQVAGLLDQHVAHPTRGCASSGRKPRRARADDGYLHAFRRLSCQCAPQGPHRLYHRAVAANRQSV